MKILVVSFSQYKFVGRLKQLLRAMEHIGDVHLITLDILCHKSEKLVTIEYDTSKDSKFMVYLRFLINTLVYAKRLKPDLVLVDNTTTSIVGLAIHRLLSPKYLVQDVREFYFAKDMPRIFGKALVYFEAKLMKKANIVICANQQRADLMSRIYQIKRPIVFENIRVLDEEVDEELYKSKHAGLFDPNQVKIISSGGLSVKRTTDVLVEAMSKLGDRYALYIVGGGSKEDENTIKNIINRYRLKNVFLMGRVQPSELRYLVQQCDIGIVNYHDRDLNNHFCASGKVYEFLAEGLPIVTTENPPLKELCEKFGIGESDNTYLSGITKVASNIHDYRKNVKLFMKSISVEENNRELAAKIMNILADKRNSALE